MLFFQWLRFACFISLAAPVSAPSSPDNKTKLENGLVDDEVLAANRLKFAQKLGKKKPDPVAK